jgi:hypothetical protein
MDAQTAQPHESDDRTLDLLEEIQRGTLDPKVLKPPQRQTLVDFLASEGHSTAEIAKILHCSDKTIERDKKAIFQAGAIELHPKLPLQMVGALVKEASLAKQKISRVARDKNTPAAVKVDAYHRNYLIISDLTQRLQGLGIMPNAAKKIEATIIDDANMNLGLDELEKEIIRLKSIESETIESGDNNNEHETSTSKS